ncbi:uncharacterized protein L199_004726 [Kwoniella botswanensis]|uniref:uncharacterized protein n=1 Tax=Kwoniella botswanensis TaxID=1268659 RepID=UPI00315DB8AE
MYVVTKNHSFYSPISPDIPPLEVILGCGDPADLLPPRKDQGDVYDSASVTVTDSEPDDDLDFDTKLGQIYHDNNDNNLVNSSNSIGTTNIQQISQSVHTIDTYTINNEHSGTYHNTTNSNNIINNHHHQRQYVDRLMDDIIRNNSFIMNNANFINKRDKSLTSSDSHEDDCATDESEFGGNTSNNSERHSHSDYPLTPPTSSPTPEDDDPPRRHPPQSNKNVDANPFSTKSLDLRRLPLPPSGGESTSMASKRKAKDKGDHRGSKLKTKKTGEKGARTKVACQACRERKAKCSGDEVCSRCLQFNLVCEYEEIRRRSPSPKSSSRGKISHTDFIPHQNVPEVKDETHDRTRSEIGPEGYLTPESGDRSLEEEEVDDVGEEAGRRFDREGKKKAREQ